MNSPADRLRVHTELAQELVFGADTGSKYPDGTRIIRSDEAENLAAAQVHAILALAAAVEMVPGGIN